MWAWLLTGARAADWAPLPVPERTGGGEQDAALIVGDGPDALDWALWFTVARAVPPERVVRVRQAGGPLPVLPGPGPGGATWVVSLGPGGPPLGALEAVAPGPRVLVIDAPEILAPVAVSADTVLVLGSGERLPGSDRRVASTLALGGLRGWADADGDGWIRARELGSWCVRAAVSAGAGALPELLGDPDRVLARGTEAPPDLLLPDRLPLDAVARLITGSLDARDCFGERFRAGLPTPARLTLRFVIPPSGRVEAVRIVEEDLRDDPLEACLSAALAEVPFPPTAGAGATITWPLVLR